MFESKIVLIALKLSDVSISCLASFRCDKVT